MSSVKRIAMYKCNERNTQRTWGEEIDYEYDEDIDKVGYERLLKG